MLSEEVEALPADCELTRNRDFSVYLARAAQIPAVLEEIGRCRELAFRAAGEGTGGEQDLDRFDETYQHLFLWNRRDARIAGGYRLAVTSDILPHRGIPGLYTSTLFHYDQRFFDRIGPAVELGRSFVMPEYQRSYSSLLLLWKGILRAVARRPEAPVLFGAVSISREYQEASRSLVATYLSRRAAHPLARFVKARVAFRTPSGGDRIQRLADAAASVEDISSAISDIERDSKGVPVLLRHYLKAGGRLLGFNVDRRFANVVDALIVVDLHANQSSLVERCMGTQ